MLEQFYIPLTNIFFKIISAFVIFLIALIVGRFAGIIVANLLQELRIEVLLETIGIRFFISKTAGTIVSLAIYVAGLLMALNQIGIARIFAIVISSLFAVLIVLAIIFGIADVIRNFFAGLRLRKKYLAKKTIELPIVKGKIIQVNLTNIKVITKENDVLVVPFIALD